MTCLSLSGNTGVAAGLVRLNSPHGPAIVKNIQELARQHTSDAIEALASIARAGRSESAREMAATALLDRGYGRPQQSTTLRVIKSIEDLTDAELEALSGSVAEQIGEALH
jgi:hypothetical protein